MQTVQARGSRRTQGRPGGQPPPQRPSQRPGEAPQPRQGRRLRTASEIAQERTEGWEPPPAQPRQPTAPQEAPWRQPAGQAPGQAPGQPRSPWERLQGVVGQQFQAPRAREGLIKALDATAKARYFRDAGIGEALRYSLDPAGYRPHPMMRIRTPRNVGLQPDRVEVIEHEQHW